MSQASKTGPSTTPEPTVGVAKQSSSGLSTGAVAGIAVGSALGGLIVAVAGFIVWRRHQRHRSQSSGAVTVGTDGREQDMVGKAELEADRPATGLGNAQATSKSELATNSNRHELDHTMSANPHSPWMRSDAELEG